MSLTHNEQLPVITHQCMDCDIRIFRKTAISIPHLTATIFSLKIVSQKIDTDDTKKFCANLDKWISWHTRPQ